MKFFLPAFHKIDQPFLSNFCEAIKKTVVQSTNTNDTHPQLQVQADHRQMVQKNEANLGKSELYNIYYMVYFGC